ncbi:hypothetical protein ACRALDRAFT_1077791 [Sodiomyces alcalophilus JCM 7366]|uniref:uncharacterized protein n=1 Tax=Sodiomyces alcalophilus JCM 7366 TaxID=591952 RepID=UPI0039B58962
MAKVATDFEKIIQEGRERKKNQALAEKIFSKDRRQSAPPKTKFGGGPSLASRVGVRKRTSLGATKPIPAGNVDGDWTHDLHRTVNKGGNVASRAGGKGANKPAQKPRRTERRGEQRAARIENALKKEDAEQPVPAPVDKGLSIRGLAGPFAVMAQNFAPGTTAADIESAMTPVGGEMLSCTIMKTNPMMVVEMLFASREGGDAVIATFNNKKADGRLIKVYAKPGGYKPFQRNSAADRQNGNIVDGLYGFDDSTPEDNPHGNLYSDTLVGGSRRDWAYRGGR